MFWDKKQAPSKLSVACTLKDNAYSLSGVKNNKKLVFYKSREFTLDSVEKLAKTFAKDVDELDIIAHPCQLILLPQEYQLILMDAPDVPEDEVLQALRWSLKGLSDYDLGDVAIDAFSVPVHGMDGSKKVIVALTPLSALNKKRALLEASFVKVNRISIAEMALRNVFYLACLGQKMDADTPSIVVSLCDAVYKVHIIDNNMFYLIRNLDLGPDFTLGELDTLQPLIFELERSINYCMRQLRLARPTKILFTPGFLKIKHLFESIDTQLGLECALLDLSPYLDTRASLSLEEQDEVFYSIGGALKFNYDKKKT